MRSPRESTSVLVCELLLQDTDQSKISSAILCGSAVLAAALISTEVIHRRTCFTLFFGTFLGEKVLLNICGSLSYHFVVLLGL